jgi:hypothetical protein
MRDVACNPEGKLAHTSFALVVGPVLDLLYEPQQDRLDEIARLRPKPSKHEIAIKAGAHVFDDAIPIHTEVPQKSFLFLVLSEWGTLDSISVY